MLKKKRVEVKKRRFKAMNDVFHTDIAHNTPRSGISTRNRHQDSPIYIENFATESGTIGVAMTQKIRVHGRDLVHFSISRRSARPHLHQAKPISLAVEAASRIGWVSSCGLHVSRECAEALHDALGEALLD